MPKPAITKLQQLQTRIHDSGSPPPHLPLYSEQRNCATATVSQSNTIRLVDVEVEARHSDSQWVITEVTNSILKALSAVCEDEREAATMGSTSLSSD